MYSDGVDTLKSLLHRKIVVEQVTRQDAIAADYPVYYKKCTAAGCIGVLSKTVGGCITCQRTQSAKRSGTVVSESDAIIHRKLNQKLYEMQQQKELDSWEL